MAYFGKLVICAIMVVMMPCMYLCQTALDVDPLWDYFSAVAGQDGEIDVNELQAALSSSGISGSYQNFNEATCVVLIKMLDRDYSGKMGFTEFQELWDAVNQWKQSFIQYDSDRSGVIQPHELHSALVSYGYNLSPNALNTILGSFSTDGRIAFDNFVLCMIRLRFLTDQFRRRDTEQNGYATFQYDDFIQVAIYV